MNALQTIAAGLRSTLLQATAVALTVFIPDAPLVAAPADLDPSFRPRFANPLSIPWIQNLIVEQDRQVLVFGTISTDTIPPNPGLARLRVDGDLDTAYRPGLKGTVVHSVISLRSGKTLVGGLFSVTAGTLARTNLARLEPDGSLDANFDAGQMPSSTRFSLLELPDGKLLLGGSFSDYQRSGRSGLVRLHPDGRVDESFPRLPYPRVIVDALVPGSEDSVVVFGTYFGTDAGFPVRMTRILHDGSEDPAFHHPNLWIENSVGAAGAGGTLYVSTPAFGVAESIAEFDVVRLLRSGEPDPAFKARVTGAALVVQPGNGIVNPPAIRAMHRQPDGRLVIAGKFDHVNGVFRRNLARLEPDGSLDLSFDPGAGPVNTVDSAGFGYAIQSMVPSRDGRIYLVGTFNAYNRQAVSGLIRIQGDPIPRFQGTHGSPSLLHTTWVGPIGETVAFETSTNLLDWMRWSVVTNELGTVPLSLPVGSATFVRATTISTGVSKRP